MCKIVVNRVSNLCCVKALGLRTRPELTVGFQAVFSFSAMASTFIYS